MQNSTVSVYSDIWSLQKESIIVVFSKMIKAMAKLQLDTLMEISTVELLKMICIMARVF